MLLWHVLVPTIDPETNEITQTGGILEADTREEAEERAKEVGVTVVGLYGDIDTPYRGRPCD